MSEEIRTDEKQEWVKLRPSSIVMPLLCIVLLLAVCPVLSYNTDEVHCLAGGLEESPLIHSNFFGKLGTAFAWRFLLTFGVMYAVCHLFSKRKRPIRPERHEGNEQNGTKEQANDSRSSE